MNNSNWNIKANYWGYIDYLINGQKYLDKQNKLIKQRISQLQLELNALLELQKDLKVYKNEPQ